MLLIHVLSLTDIHRHHISGAPSHRAPRSKYVVAQRGKEIFIEVVCIEVGASTFSFLSFPEQNVRNWKFWSEEKKPFPKSLMQRCRRRRAKDAAAARPHVLGPPSVARDLGDHRQVRTARACALGEGAEGRGGRGGSDRTGASFVVAAELSSTDAHLH
jgi:hypothetical protein